ncbi:MAG: hypothetical protein JOZ16_09985 [Methylobacteriaceae bacterium]|nr:hypothetical protein [Methylobacteriaceae bacterium]
MTLPSDAVLEPAAPTASPSIDALLLDPDAVGGGAADHFDAARRGAPESVADTALSSEILAATPIGGEGYRMKGSLQPGQVFAENAVQESARPVVQGRSVSKHAARSARHAHRTRPASSAARQRFGACTCELASGRSVAAPARRWQSTSAFSPPSGLAGIVTMFPFLDW